MTKRARDLDDRDRCIIARLRCNARTPVSVLARELNLSRSAVVARLARLIRDGVLTGYSARITPNNDAVVRAWFFIKLAPGLTCASVVGEMSSRTELSQCYALAGEWDLLIQAATESALAMSDLRDWLASLPGVATINTQTVLATHLDR